jgi:DDE superfamily endonuclease
VAAMENVLDVYMRPYDPDFPVVCMDETPRQLIWETRKPIPGAIGRAERYDFEYERRGVFNIFMANEPLAGMRIVKASERKTKSDWAVFIKEIARHYRKAKKMTLVMDNLNTHKAGSLYETFPPREAKRIWNRFDFVCTPKHGSWLNMAEIELNVLIRQCLSCRMDNMKQVGAAVKAWQRHRDNLNAKIDWQFTTEDARVKLRRLYPTFET